MTTAKVLIVDDEASIRKLIISSLAKEKYTIDEADSGQKALERLKADHYDLIILDIMLGDIDGFDLIRRIKEMKIISPIMVLSGRNDDYDKILGLGLGANNYLTKPFSPAALCAYAKALIRDHRKSFAPTPTIIEVGKFRFDNNTFKLYKSNEHIDLTSKECMLIKFLMENPNQVFSKQQLYENVWDDIIVDDNAIMVYIHNLRKKIEHDPKNPKHLITVWGIGYKFVG